MLVILPFPTIGLRPIYPYSVGEMADASDSIDEEALAGITRHLVGQIIESAKHYLAGGEPSDIKQKLKELVERVEVSEEEVTLRYNFKNPDTKVAQLVAPQVGFEPTT